MFFLFVNNLSLSVTVLFYIKILKIIISCVGIGGSIRCDEVFIVLFGVWKILLMVGVRGGLIDFNWFNLFGCIFLN